MRRPLRDRPDGPEEDRLFDLMRERAVHGLDDDEMRELNQLAARHADVDVECYDRTAAALDIVFAERRCASLPDDLKRRIAKSAPRSALETIQQGAREPELGAPGDPTDRGRSDRAPATRPLAVPAGPRRAPNWPAWTGWGTAAAATIAAIVGWLREPTPLAPEELVALLRHEVDTAADSIVLPWSPTEDPDGRNVSGDLHWSTALQKGYMRFRGLPANDPHQKQYQLWIFDTPRGTDHPVDGGVFDVVAAEVIVPIDAKIRVMDPALFAVTAEAPGGVVVSKRESIVSLAQR